MLDKVKHFFVYGILPEVLGIVQLPCTHDHNSAAENVESDGEDSDDDKSWCIAISQAMEI